MGRPDQGMSKERILREIDLALTVVDLIQKYINTLKSKLLEIYKEIQEKRIEE